MASRADQDQRVYSRSYLTKLRVAEAMDRLCAAMPFARVRIEDIVRESGVSRSNFYHNFSDKNAVVTWIAEQCHANGIFRIGRDLTWFEGHMITTRDMARNFYHNFSDKNAVVTWIAEQCHANGIFRIGRDLTWFEGHMITTRDMARFRTLFNSAAGSTEYAAAEPYFVRARQHNLVETLTDYQHRAIDEQLSFQIEAWPHCELVMAGKFRAGALPYGLKAFCNYLVAMTPRELYEALEPFQIEAWPHCELVMAGKFRAGALPYGLKAFCNYLVAMTPRELYEALEHPVANAAPGELAELR